MRLQAKFSALRELQSASREELPALSSAERYAVPYVLDMAFKGEL